MKYWRYPNKWWEWFPFVIGFQLFWLLTPYWLWMAINYWKNDTAFIFSHIQGVCYNPWCLWEK